MTPVLTKDPRLANTVMLHFATAGIIFAVACVLIYFSASSFIGHYFHPKLLSITHIITLGWISLVIIGALYQIAPVIANIKLYSISFTYITYFLLISGILLLSVSFWHFTLGYTIQIASLLLLAGVTLFAVNILLTLHKAHENNLASDFISASACWFWLTATLGTLMVYNFEYTFLTHEHLYFLKIHVHIGVIGWFSNLIIGVASKLLPMFLVSRFSEEKPLTFSYYFLNLGLLGFTLDSLFLNGLERSLIYIILIFCSIPFFAYFLIQVYKNRLRKNLDIGLLQTTVSLFLLAFPLITTLILKSGLISNESILNQLSIATTFGILFGFITLLIMGQTLKNLSFISWLKKYQGVAGKPGVPLPKDLYSEQIARYQLYFFLAGFFLMETGIVFSSFILISVGALSNCITSLFYLLNVFKIISHNK